MNSGYDLYSIFQIDTEITRKCFIDVSEASLITHPLGQSAGIDRTREEARGLVSGLWSSGGRKKHGGVARHFASLLPHK